LLNGKKKLEKPEKFIGWTSEDGNLEVIGIEGKDDHGHTLFKVTCKTCSQDPELFHDGYFVSTKGNLKNNHKPCGCSKRYKWCEEQSLIRVKRKVEDKEYTIYGFAEDYKGKNTKLNLKCVKDHNWTTRLSDVLVNNSGCPVCYGNVRLTEQEALHNCMLICDIENYKPVGFINGYVNNTSCFEYECPKHGVQKVSYNSFVSRGNRCKGCAKYGYNPNKSGTFYIVKWTKDNHRFIKFGITNQKLKARLRTQNSKTKYNYEIIYTNTWDDGNIPLKIERSIKSSRLFERCVIDKDDFKDGYTETLEESLTNLLISYVNNEIQMLTL